VSGPDADRIQTLFEASRDLLAVLVDSRIVLANPAWGRVLGRPPETLIGTDLLDLVHPDDLETTVGYARELLEDPDEQATIDNRYRHADGHWVWLRWTSVTRGADGAVYIAAHDFTVERNALADARAAIARMEESQRVAHVGSWEQDLRTDQRTYTPNMYAILGLDPERDATLGLNDLLARVVPEHHDRIRGVIAKLYAEPGIHELEYRMTQPAGRVIWTLVELERDADGEPVRLRGTSQDVTALRDNERRLADAERVAGLGSFEWRLSDGAIWWSAGTYLLWERDPALGPIGDDEFWPVMLPEEAERARATIAMGGRDNKPWEIEYSVPLRDGTRRVLLSRSEPFTLGDEQYVRGTIQDVTRERRATRQQQEIARLGQLALAGTDLRALFDEVCRVTIELLGTDMVTILALQGDDSFALASSVGLPAWVTDGGGTAIAAGEDSVVRHALTADAPLLVPDWEREERYPYSEPLRKAEIRCTMVLPIRGREAPFGALATHARTPGVDDPTGNVAFLDALGSFLATAIERARHEAEIAALATLRGRLVAENLEAEERVRQRISEQLHDGALQDLLAARQDLVEAAGENGDAAMRGEMLGYAREGVERAVKLLREAVHALHPVVLQHGGLEAAMQAAAGQAARQGGFFAEVVVDPAATGLRDELVMSLARELLNNCAKHSQAEHVHVTVGRVDGTVLLEVSDDGRGLDPHAVASAPMHGHIGLASLTQRVEAVGGTLDLSGGDGGGTTVVARLPIG
jgi:PAS domain S-box-containing protein